MGKRRIRNLLFLKIDKSRIFGFDPSQDKREEAEEKYGIKTFSDFKTAIKETDPDTFIISTPPNLHHDYFLYAAKNKKHFFVEATTVDKGYSQLSKLNDNSFISAPSCTFRYFPAVKKIKELINKNKIGKVLFFNYHLGQYLPDWHPWEDYRKVYFAQKETGACREMLPFELIWLTDIFGAHAKQITGMASKISSLDMPADDLYSAILNFENNIIGHIVIDVLARTPFRTLRIIGTEGVLEWEWLNYEIKFFQAKNKKWEVLNLKKGENEKGYVTTEDMYREEIEKFLQAIAGKIKYPYSFEEDHRILKTLFALEKSDKTGKKIKLQ